MLATEARTAQTGPSPTIFDAAGRTRMTVEPEAARCVQWC